MSFTLAETWIALPPGLRWAVALGPLIPLLGWFSWVVLVGRQPPAIAIQLAGRAAALVAFTLAVLAAMATLSTARTGFDALITSATDAALRRQRSAETGWRTATDSAGAAAVAAREATDGRIALAALTRYPCRTNCLLAVAGPPPGPAVRRLARRLAALPPSRVAALGRPDDRTMVVARVPLRDPTGRPAALLLAGITATDVVANARRLALQLTGATLVLAFAAFLITRSVVGRTLSHRVEELIAHVGEPPAATAPPGDELERLSTRVSELVQRSVDLETQLHQAQKMEAVGRLTGGIAHDFNNLLTVIRANAALLRDRVHREELDDIDRAAQRGAALVRRLMAFGRHGELELAAHPLGPLLHELFATLRRVLPDQVRLELPSRIPTGAIDVDRAAFDQVLLNLVTNARDAMPDGGTLGISVAVGAPPGDLARANDLDPTARYLMVTVSDTGTGMTPEVAARAFDPFFTTKPPDRGTGLGLAMVYGLMRRHRGAVQLASASGRGTAATLWFPYRDAPDPTVTPSGGVPAVPREGARGGHLLVIEDEAMVRRTTELTLKRLGYAVTTAEHGKEGLEALEGPTAFLAVVSDVQMPVMGGLEFVRAARSRGHRVPILLVSGYSLEDVNGVIARHQDVAALGKPWSSADLVRALEQLLGPRA